MMISLSACILVSTLFVSPVVDGFAAMALRNHFVGFDLGTSGARISIIKTADGSDAKERTYREIHSDSITWDTDNPYDVASAWTGAVSTLLGRASERDRSLLSRVRSMCVSGTSASCLVIDAKNGGKVTRSPRMYDFDVASSSNADDAQHGVRAMDLLDEHAPPRHTARARTGSLAKLLRWNEERPLRPGEVLCHQADYVAMTLMHEPKACGSGLDASSRTVASDWHNCLKLGYDVRNLEWPDWLVACLENAGVSDPVGSGVVPPMVVSPGEPIGTVSKTVAETYGLPDDTVLVGGTTDSNAAFFAAVGTSPDFGTAVTSLGSTLAIKMLSSAYVEDADRGVYSHRFPVFGDEDESGEAWLIGGASNVGCAVLRQLSFSSEELQQLSAEIDPGKDSPLSYYPLTKKGERFPTADSEREPLLEPVPESRRDYLHAILQGISDVERDGFEVMGKLGASPRQPRLVWTCGGGAKNDMWLKMRERRLSAICSDGGTVTVNRATNTEASYGAAILASATFQ